MSELSAQTSAEQRDFLFAGWPRLKRRRLQEVNSYRGRGSGDADPPRDSALSGRAADDCWWGHHPLRWPALPVSPGAASGLVPGVGGHGPTGQWTLHGHEESPGGSARTLSSAPPHRDTLQPPAGLGHTKEVGPNTPGDVHGLSQQGARA